MTTTTCLGFDYGTKQIGVAFGQPVTCSAAPVCTLRAKDGIPDWSQIEHLITEWRPEILIVGLPLNMDGSESEFCSRARKFARRLQGRFGLPAQMVDERLTTFSAKDQLQQYEDFKNHPIDAEAAAILLESWLNNPQMGLAP